MLVTSPFTVREPVSIRVASPFLLRPCGVGETSEYI
jgi:hypothetical protein